MFLTKTPPDPTTLRLPAGPEADKLAWLKGIQLSLTPEDDKEPTPNLELTPDDADKLLQLMERIKQTPRDDTPMEAHLARIDKELDYFERSNSLKLLLALQTLIDRFVADGVVWGVGRGSSCASYVLYLMRVHDINPIRYDIPFSEFSKEK